MASPTLVGGKLGEHTLTQKDLEKPRRGPEVHKPREELSMRPVGSRSLERGGL